MYLIGSNTFEKWTTDYTDHMIDYIVSSSHVIILTDTTMIYFFFYSMHCVYQKER